MDINIQTVAQCTGGNHRHISFTIGTNPTVRQIAIDRTDINFDPDQEGDIRNAIIDRLRSALKEGGATLVLATWKTALEGKAFKI